MSGQFIEPMPSNTRPPLSVRQGESGGWMLIDGAGNVIGHGFERDLAELLAKFCNAYVNYETAVALEQMKPGGSA